MPDHVDAERSRRARHGLDYIDCSRRDQDENECNDDRNRSPREFDRIASVNLRRLAAVVARARAKTNHAVRQQRSDDQKDRCADRDHEEGDGVDLVSGSRDCVEYAARRNFGVGLAHPPVVGPRDDRRSAESGDRHPAALQVCGQFPSRLVERIDGVSIGEPIPISQELVAQNFFYH